MWVACLYPCLYRIREICSIHTYRYMHCMSVYDYLHTYNLHSAHASPTDIKTHFLFNQCSILFFVRKLVLEDLYTRRPYFYRTVLWIFIIADCSWPYYIFMPWYNIIYIDIITIRPHQHRSLIKRDNRVSRYMTYLCIINCVS